jgi:hypothetical protein
LHRSGVSGLGKPAQAGLTTIGTFNYFAGDDPTSPVFLTSSGKEQTRTLKGHLHIGYRSAIEGISDHVILPCDLSYFGGLEPGDFNHPFRYAAASIWRSFCNNSSRCFPGRNPRARALNFAAA